MTLTLATGQLRAATRKPANVGPGRIAWFDITTTNLPQSKEFYGKLFDWRFNPVQSTDRAVEIVADGKSERCASPRARSARSTKSPTSR
jgi:hypothetical protein